MRSCSLRAALLDQYPLVGGVLSPIGVGLRVRARSGDSMAEKLEAQMATTIRAGPGPCCLDNRARGRLPLHCKPWWAETGAALHATNRLDFYFWE